MVIAGEVALLSSFKKKNTAIINNNKTRGVPAFDLLGSDSEYADRYRNWFDPASVFDRGV